jgi:hypothetical protein
MIPFGERETDIEIADGQVAEDAAIYGTTFGIA